MSLFDDELKNTTVLSIGHHPDLAEGLPVSAHAPKAGGTAPKALQQEMAPRFVRILLGLRRTRSGAALRIFRRLDPYRSHRSTRFHAVPTSGAILPYRSFAGRLPDCLQLKRLLYHGAKECQY
jgi:hypothetical protein